VRSVTKTTIHAPATRIYQFAHATERWPQLLPHYRFVRILAEREGERTLEMGARRGVIPVRWTAVQRNDPATPAIYFRHTKGWTAGMEVAWTFEERDGLTDVSIVHDVEFSFPVARSFIERHIVTEYFIEGIAARTLSCMKALAEDPFSA